MTLLDLGLMGRRPRCLLAAFLVAGCVPQHAETPKLADPEVNSGPDGKRSGATPMEVNKQYTDNVDFDKADRSDWKQLELKGKPGVLTVELHWDNPAADLNVDVFDSTGAQVSSSPAKGELPFKKLLAQIENLGIYYVRVQAANAKDASDYTTQAKWEVEEAPVEKEAKKAVRHSSGGGSPAPKKAASKGSPENGVQGRIVSSYREGDSLVLHLDKGAAAGVAVGQQGWILEGPSGSSALEGGNFTVTSVIDDSRSIGKATLKSLSKNTRISINTGK